MIRYATATWSTTMHDDIVRAIERGDPDAAERAKREHIVYVQDLVSVVRRIEAGQMSGLV